MSWNPTISFDAGLADLRRIDTTPKRTDRPDTIRRGDIRMAHSVFQRRLFNEDLHKDEDHVEELVRVLKAKQETRRVLDAVLVMAIGPHFYCVDGHHRLLAYLRVGVDGEIPVEHFEGSLEDAVREAIERNAKDRLAMTHGDKLEGAWRLVVLNVHSKSEIARASGVAVSGVGNMRAVRLQILEKHKRTAVALLALSWEALKKWLKGEAHVEFTDEAKAAQTREWARRFAKTFGRKALKQPDVFADAIHLYSKKLPGKLIEEWVEIAVETLEAMRDEGSFPELLVREPADDEPTPF